MNRDYMNQPLLLRMNEAAELCSVSKNTLYNMVHDGRIPVVKFGKILRIPYESLRKAIEAVANPNPERPDIERMMRIAEHGISYDIPQAKDMLAVCLYALSLERARTKVPETVPEAT
jgi:excisionase family DNA binding protein